MYLYLGAKEHDLVDIYTKQIRSVLELAVPAWHGGITLAEQIDIERIQKCALHIILGDKYSSYRNALSIVNLETLRARRDKLCLKFAIKAEKHDKFRKWFKPSVRNQNTRQVKPKYCDVLARHARFENSPLGHLTRILNQHHSK